MGAEQPAGAAPEAVRCVLRTLPREFQLLGRKEHASNTLACRCVLLILFRVPIRVGYWPGDTSTIYSLPLEMEPFYGWVVVRHSAPADGASLLYDCLPNGLEYLNWLATLDTTCCDVPLDN
ncbi:unnamed protein product [Ostreobium quekettii]|uniref:Uncharacterized protein n=1 Tax=Ostreobium quekettii TaxID=121088 RepID=A0A8S1IX40_9CHLO|nr:unnamed protein product [Ostreobium quekettii]